MAIDKIEEENKSGSDNKMQHTQSLTQGFTDEDEEQFEDVDLGDGQDLEGRTHSQDPAEASANAPNQTHSKTTKEAVLDRLVGFPKVSKKMMIQRCLYLAIVSIIIPSIILVLTSNAIRDAIAHKVGNKPATRPWAPYVVAVTTGFFYPIILSAIAAIEYYKNSDKFFCWKKPAWMMSLRWRKPGWLKSRFVRLFFDVVILSLSAYLGLCLHGKVALAISYCYCFHLLPLANLIGMTENIGLFDGVLSISLGATMAELEKPITIRIIVVLAICFVYQAAKHLNEFCRQERKKKLAAARATDETLGAVHDETLGAVQQQQANQDVVLDIEPLQIKSTTTQGTSKDDFLKENDGFIVVDGQRFTLNGIPFYVNGFNAFWLTSVASEEFKREKISLAFQVAAEHGLTIARTHGSPRKANVEQWFKGMDFVISEARKHGIRLILTLLESYNEPYVTWEKGVNAHQNDFFKKEEQKKLYKDHIKAVLTRKNSITEIAYKDDPTIMAWELMPQLKCTSDPSGKTVQDWIEEMAAYVKTLDRNHLLEAGLEGFYGESNADKNPKNENKNPNFQVGTDFIANHNIPHIDFATVHFYADKWLTNKNHEDQLSGLGDWLRAHIDDARDIIEKPLLVAAFSKSSWNCRDESRRKDVFDQFYKAVQVSATEGKGLAGTLFSHFRVRGVPYDDDDGSEVEFRNCPIVAAVIKEQSALLKQIREQWISRKRIKGKGKLPDQGL